MITVGLLNTECQFSITYLDLQYKHTHKTFLWSTFCYNKPSLYSIIMCGSPITSLCEGSGKKKRQQHEAFTKLQRPTITMNMTIFFPPLLILMLSAAVPSLIFDTVAQHRSVTPKSLSTAMIR